MNILVLDVGTSSMRGTLWDMGPDILWKDQLTYSPDYPGDGLAEQDPADWLGAAEKLCAGAAGFAAVDAVALTSQRSSVIPADGNGQPLGPAIMWQDTRNRALCESLASSEERVRAVSGTGINTVFSGGKMTWLRRERPEVYNKAVHLFVIPEYLVFHMTGESVLDYTYGSRSMLMDLRRNAWSGELLELFGVEEKKLGRLIPPSSVAGRVTEAFSRRTGLPSGIPVVTCGGDQQCAALGQGVFRTGSASVNLGTGAYLISPAAAVPDTIPAGVLCNASAVPGTYILESSVLTCGGALNWFLREIAGNADVSLAGEALSVSPPGAGGVVALPYFQGRSAPDWNSEARASFCGMTLSTRREDLLRALLEGICTEVSRGLDAMSADIGRIHVSGGLSRTPEICRLLADVTGHEVLRSGEGDATTRGAWMSAAVCLGLAPDWDAAWEQIRDGESDIFRPDTDNTALYAGLRIKMDALYNAEKTAGGQ